MDLVAIYSRISDAATGRSDHYMAREIPSLTSHFVARFADRPALLFPTTGTGGVSRAPIELENLQVRYSAQCTVVDGDQSRSGLFTVVRCLSGERAIHEYFLRTLESVIFALRGNPSEKLIEEAIAYLIELFRSMGSPPTRAAAGLFGELVVALRSPDPFTSIEAWRADGGDRFDFAIQDVRIEVKTSSTRRRLHEFSFDQCSPPTSTVAVVVSMFVEQIGGGVTIGELVARLRDRLGDRADLVRKLHTNVAKTLGSEIVSAERLKYDERLAVSSTKYFLALKVPAIRGDLPSGVAGVRFWSDLESAESESSQDLARESLVIARLLPGT